MQWTGARDNTSKVLIWSDKRVCFSIVEDHVQVVS